MVFNRHLKALNLCNHSDTIACVLYELLVKFGIDYCEFPKLTSRFHKFQFCSIFKVLLGCCVFRNSLYIIPHKSSFVKNFFRYFFEALRLQNRYTGCRYRLQRLCSLRDSLIIIARSTTFVKNFFRIFLQSFGGVFGQGVYSRVVVGWVLCVGVVGDYARLQSLSHGCADTAYAAGPFCRFATSPHTVGSHPLHKGAV